MADSKVSALTSATPVGTDELYLVDDPGGTPSSKRATVADVGGVAVTTHVAASDPHGDRAYADGLASNYQPADSDLTAIAALTTTAYGRALLELADAAAARTALGLGTAATTAATAYATAAQGTLADSATQPGDLAAVATSGSGTDITTGTVADARIASTIARDSEVTTAVSDHSAATDPHGDRAYADGLASNYQPVDSDLTAIAALTTTTFGRSLLAQADAAATRTTLGLGTAAELDSVDDDTFATASATTVPTSESVKAYVDAIASGTFSNADHTITTETYLAQTGTLTADRTVTLPAASSVVRGYEITVADESGTVTNSNRILIQRAGADTILNPANLDDSTTVKIGGPGSRKFTSDGVSQWVVTETGIRRPFSWWTHDHDLSIPTGVWTPLPWNPVTYADDFGILEAKPGNTAAGGTPQATTIAAASNGDVLPQATINVASTAGFLDAGYLVITGPPGTGDDTVVTYTGKTATTFTGCNSSYRNTGVGISTGTLATGHVVEQANCEWYYPTGYLYQIVCQVTLESIPTTSTCHIRLRSIDGLFYLSIFSNSAVGMNLSGSPHKGQHLILTGQPGTLPSGPSRIEVWHDAGGSRLSKIDSIMAPSIMQAFLSAY